jgi:outer membrane murein-binding lipoprotein Lpp
VPSSPVIQSRSEFSERTGIPRRQQILLPLIALIALIAGGVAAYGLTHEPKTATLQSEVSALQGQLATADQQLTTLRRSVGAAPSSAALRRLVRNVDGLKHTVGGLQDSSVPLQAKVQALNVCVPQLQRELTGTSVVTGHGKHAVRTRSVGLSAACESLLGAG